MPTPFPRSVTVPGFALGEPTRAISPCAKSAANRVITAMIHRTVLDPMADLIIRTSRLFYQKSRWIMQPWVTASSRESVQAPHREPDPALHSRPVQILHLPLRDGEGHRFLDGDARRCHR